jgi:hypothetical protein
MYILLIERLGDKPVLKGEGMACPALRDGPLWMVFGHWAKADNMQLYT